MPHHRAPLVIVSVWIGFFLGQGFGLAQGMKIPGEETVQSNVVKPAPLEATPERIAGLKLPAGFRIDKFAEGLTVPRVIVVADDGTVYVSSREAGTISMLRVTNGRVAAPKVVLEKKNVHGMAVRDGRLFYTSIREFRGADPKGWHARA